ncbi:MAG: membrane protein insertase YidC [bacterium]
MEERALLAIVLSLLIIIGYQFLFVSKGQKIPLKLPDKAVKESQPVENIEDTGLKPIDREIEINELREPLKEIIKLQEQRRVENINFETDRYKTILTNKNASFKSWELKKFKATPEYTTSVLKKAFWSQVLQEYKNYFFNKNREINQLSNIDLVSKLTDNDLKSDDFLNLKLLDPELNDFGIGNYDFKFISENKIEFIFIDSKGLQITKSLEFNENDYQVKLNIEIKNLTQKKINKDYFLVWEQIFDESEGRGHRNFIGAGFFLNNKKKSFKIGKIKDTIKNNYNIGWISLENNYFTSCIIPLQDDHESIILKKRINEKYSKLSIGIKYPSKLILPGSIVKDEYLIYMGPKLERELVKVDQNLKYVINYGFFSFLARPTILLLRFIYKYIPNYGWAIILLTILTKIIFYPLTEKSFQSMKKMQTLQPKIAEIKKKYKNDMVQINQETMALYKEHHVNPMGGCLPMLIQIPVFFALYEALLVAIEIRGAPFMFWITDLSAMDPLLITPIIMGVTMFFQQKTMSTSIDPAQAKLFAIMPIMFTFFFLGFPSGLVLYWMLNNILTIGHQYIVNKINVKKS